VLQVYQIENLADFAVDIAVIVVDALVIRGVNLVFMMGGIVELPHAVMDAVGSHLDEHEEIPVFFRDPLLDQLKTLFGHGVNLAQQVIFVVSAEVGNIYQVVAHRRLDLLHDGRGIGIGSLSVFRGGRQEATYLNAVDRFGGIGLRYAHRNHFFACARQHIPDAVGLHRVGVRQHMLLIRMIAAIAETIEAQRAGVFTRHHGTPCGDGDGGDAAFQLAPRTMIHHALKIGQLIAPLFKNKLRWGAVQPDYQNPFSPIHEHLPFYLDKFFAGSYFVDLRPIHANQLISIDLLTQASAHSLSKRQLINPSSSTPNMPASDRL